MSMVVCGDDDGMEGVVIPQLFQRRNAPKRYITRGLGSCGGHDPTNFESDKTRLGCTDIQHLWQWQ
jgi:hypothetical protein